MRSRYLVIFAVEGIAIGALLYLGIREAVRHFIDVSKVILQFPYVGIVANIIGLGVVLAAITAFRSLGLNKV